jgi:tRNA-splicing ligase RtcB (3'-phosphate/5'-hydroxy nucleic acid ligase)
MEGELARVDRRGSLPAGRIFGLDDWMGPAGRLTRDSQIGSIGGGNHFVEIQRVEKILDGTTAHAWGFRPGMVTVMVHTGSVSIGHLSGGYFRDVVRGLYPAGAAAPGERDLRAAGGAAARGPGGAVLGRAAQRGELRLREPVVPGADRTGGAAARSRRCGLPAAVRCAAQLHLARGARRRAVGDPPQGRVPARGLEEMAGTPFEYYGEPVLVPGSMGASSFVLAGQGNPESLSSASHGAGRTLSRGDALRGHEEEFQRFLERFRVVSPLDLRRPDVRLRRTSSRRSWRTSSRRRRTPTRASDRW